MTRAAARPAGAASPARRSAGTESAESPARRLAGFVAKYDPSIGRIVRSARAKLRRRMPGAFELVYDNYNALAIGFGPTEKTSQVIVSLAVYPRWVNLYFLHGATLADPAKILQGSGNQGRFVTLAAAADLDAPAVSALLDSAIRSCAVPMPEGRRGPVIIKSVSGRQRPRR
jgi:hypothetical protein